VTAALVRSGPLENVPGDVVVWDDDTPGEGYTLAIVRNLPDDYLDPAVRMLEAEHGVGVQIVVVCDDGTHYDAFTIEGEVRSSEPEDTLDDLADHIGVDKGTLIFGSES
jgi:hypothetical protein